MNASCVYPPSSSDSQRIAYIFSLLTFMIANAVPNSLLILIYLRSPNIREVRPNIFIFNFSVASLLTGLFVCPYHVYTYINWCWPLKHQDACLFRYTTILYTNAVATGIILLMMVERVIAVHFPFKSHVIMTTSKLWGASVAVWFLSIGIFFAHLEDASLRRNEGSCDFLLSTPKALVTILCGYVLLSLFIIVGIHLKLACTARKHVRKIKALEALTHIGGGSRPKNMKVTRTIVRVCLIYVGCYFPLIVVYLIEASLISNSMGQLSWLSTLRFCVTILAMSITVINPILVLCEAEDFRRGLRQLFKVKRNIGA